MLRPLPIVLLSAVAVLAQTAQITGRITDASSAIVAGAKVSAANEATGLGWDAATNDSGYFTMPALPPGTYRIAVQAPGFKPVTRSGVLLEIGQIVRLDFALEIGSLAEQVTVTG
ncbi:MAG: carboxypeptidase regulatory-like domain-containing protein, partial [Bryobacterales bacterium]|nr:carboxypeptidase regulatory-like domain-containing protein [Bryobacterales bacterium]